MTNNNCPKDKKEVLVDNTLYNYDLNEISDTSFDLVVTPCNIPTAVYCVARISIRNNCCNNIEYYQSYINCDPVEIIQDCNIENIICRSIAIYMNNINNNSTNCCKNKYFDFI